MCAKLLQSCLTLWPMDCSLPVSPVHGILQARVFAMPSWQRWGYTLIWGAACKWTYGSEKRSENLFHQRLSLHMRNLHLVGFPSIYWELISALGWIVYGGTEVEVMCGSYGPNLSLIQSFHWYTYSEEKHLDLNITPFLMKQPTGEEHSSDVGSFSYWENGHSVCYWDIYIYTYIHIYIYIHIHTYIHIYKLGFTYICKYKYIYTYIYKLAIYIYIYIA